MNHMYYLIEISTNLTDDTTDEEGVVTLGTKSLACNALLQLGNQNAPAHKKAHLRPSNDSQKIILEVDLISALSKSEACDQLAELLPWTSEQISNNATFTKFAGDTWAESNASVKQYLSNNSVEWE